MSQKAFFPYFPNVTLLPLLLLLAFIVITIVIVLTTIIEVHNTEPFALHNDGACQVQPIPLCG